MIFLFESDSEHTSTLVIFEIKVGIYVSGTVDCRQLVILPGAQVLMQFAVLVLPVLPCGAMGFLLDIGRCKEKVSAWKKMEKQQPIK